MDPQKKIWPGDPGRKYKLTNNTPENSDSFAPFKFANPCSLEFDQTYAGTLIRLSLRNEHSDISSKHYTMSELEMILKALKADADILLLFLRYVENVEVFTINSDNLVTKVFSVAADQETKDTRRNLKDGFLRNVKNFHSHSYAVLPHLQYETTIMMCDAKENTRQECRWIVINWVGSRSQKVVEVSQKVCTLPWLGLAVPSTPQRTGRLFCFLPMPDSEEVNPPLPVCIHGTFSLTNDRRHLKWKSSDVQNDDEALWNNILLLEMLPSCYAQCLNVLKTKFNLDKFYSYWPVISAVSETNWKIILRPLLLLLLQDELFWSQNGSWVKLQSSVYVVPQINSGQFPQVVINALISCGKVVVVLNDRVWEAVKFIYANAYPFTTITPSLVRQAIKNNSASYTNMNKAEKLKLLHYCLEDRNYNDLCGLVLLPVVNNTFAAFGNNFSSNKLYISDTKFLQTRLLANNEGVLVNVEVEDYSLHHKLIEIANTNYTNLRILTPQAFAMMLKQLLPFQNGWCCYGDADGFYNENWLKAFWNWISVHSLSYFTGIPLLPICNSKNTNGFKVVILQKNKSNSWVIKYNKNVSSYPTLITAAEKLGCNLTCSDDFQFLYHSELSNYVNDLTPSTVLNISSQTSHQNVVFTQEEATALRHFIFQYHIGLSSGQQSVVLCLCIFPTVQNSILQSLQNARCFVAGRSTALLMSEPESLNKYKFCIPQAPVILTCERGYVKNLQAMLPSISWLLTKLQVILHVILFAIENNQILKQDMLKFFSTLLEPSEYHSLIIGTEGSQVINKLKSLKFIPTSQKHDLWSPSETYDPKDPIVKGLFDGQNVFPLTPFSDIHFATLRELGMKTSATLGPSDIIKITQIICSQSDIQAEVKRANKLLQFLSSNVGNTLLNTYYNSVPFHQTLNSLSWLPIMIHPPKDYPMYLGWKGTAGNHFVSAQNLHASSSPEIHRNLPYLIGSQLNILQYEGSLSASLLTLLKIPKSVPLDAMIDQILHLICHKQKLEGDQLKRFTELLYEHLQLAVINNCESQFWHRLSQSEVVQISEDKFVQPSSVACSFDDKSMTVGKLEPYLYILPNHLQKYRKLFCFIGAIEQATVFDVLFVIENISTKPNSDSNRCLQLVIQILKWLCNSFTEVEIQKLHHKILVPISHFSGEDLKFKPINQVAVLDNDLQWLSISKELLSGINKDCFVVHPSISYDMACSLQLKPLSRVIANAEEFGIKQAGQSEQLTTRLNRILKEYKDTSVIQELLQNADDAGATEVAVYYDTRQHNSSNLLFPGMVNSYGPALLFYNNAEFTEEDFENITKIAGETKLNKPLKIGQFGVGFCSVYHITDVPSFISGENFVVFDPTLQCLRKEIKSEFNPGIKVRFYKHHILAKSNQLTPYMELCGFNPNQRFQGTLFRFPLRSQISKISENVFTTEKITSLVNKLKQDSPKLLMFLNSVRKVSFYVVDDGSFTKDFEAIVKKESVANNCDLMTFTTYNMQINECNAEKWLVATNSQQLQINHNEQKQGMASVSVKLKTNKQSDRFCVDFVKGECFYFLPLHLETGLPVHVSSNFAIMTNRRGIWKADNTSTATKESNWNRMLIKSVIFQAYISLLLYLKEMQQRKLLENYSFYFLWPLKVKEDNPWELLMLKFYNSILSSQDPLLYSSITKSWNKLNQSYFLSHNILSIDYEEAIYSSIYQVVTTLEISIVSISKEVWDKLKTDQNFENRVIREEYFIQLFYQNDVLVKVPVNAKNTIVIASLIMFANNKHNKALPDLMRTTNCIPCCPSGKIFKSPQDILDPSLQISKLFLPSDHMCPEESFLAQNILCHQALINLGMMKSLPWKLVIDRAKHAQSKFANNRDEYYKYLAILIECIKEKVVGINITPLAIKNELQIIPFLPVMQKPKDYPISWKGDSCTILSASCLKKHVERNDSVNAVYACGSQVFILDTKVVPPGLLTDTVINFLGISKDLKELDVANHFVLLLQCFHKENIESNKKLFEITNRIVTHVYKYWEGNMKNINVLIESVSCIKGRACIWHAKLNKFLHPSKVSFKWETDGPFLYQLPSTVPESLNPLMKYFGVEEDFSIDVLLNAIYQMKLQYNDNPIPSDCQSVVRLILPKLQKVSSTNEKIFLPDESFILRDVKTLKYNDAPWSDSYKELLYCHSFIERETAIQLGVMPVKNFMLQDLDITDGLDEEFGQEEKLTQRLSNILRDYPRDITFLKELLQNADDAGATKMFIILDKRYHCNEMVISEEWKQLQGPALLFWNNSTFSKEDLIGIQRIGLGSKKYDADKIGQYGIGFNVVYHYTDCPSFITNDELCILDPHYRYVANNKRKRPGRKFKNIDVIWNRFPDMKAPYLQNELHKFPIVGGSLFRLPLKLTNEMVNLSEIVKDIIDLQLLEEELKNWISNAAEALLFLRNVNDVKLFVINNEVELQCCTSSTRGKERIVKAYENAGLVMFPVRLVINSPNLKNENNWLVQLGEGNVDEPEFDWNRIKPLNLEYRPQHGIAALITAEHLKGRPFSSLPLPGETNLPVHIHGQFVLHSDRRNIWINSEKNRGGSITSSDPRANWNVHLCRAIGVAYAHFLINYPHHEEEIPSTKEALMKSLYSYYKLFPNLTLCNTEPWVTIAIYAYTFLTEYNAPILATVVKSNIDESLAYFPIKFTIQWYNLYQPDTSTEPHFCSNDLSTDIIVVLKSIGINITDTPVIICEQFNFVNLQLPSGKQLPIISVESVIKYYSNFCSQIFNGNQLPCDLASTKFKNNDSFIKFLHLLMGSDNCFSEEIEKLNDFFSLGFIVTADEKLHSLSDGKAIVSSDNWRLFLNSTQYFVHNDFRGIYNTHSKYLMENMHDQDHFEHLSSIITDNFKLSWDRKSTQVSYTDEHNHDTDWIQNMLYCLTCDPVFSMYCDQLLQRFPLLPGDNGISYSTASNILPMQIIFANNDLKPEYNLDEAKKLMEKLKVPLLRNELSSCVLQKIKIQLPSLFIPENILKSLYLITKHTFLNAYELLSQNDFILLFQILKLISFSSVCNQEYIKELPIFTTMNDKSVSLASASQVWIWNDKEVCTTGIDQWINHISNDIVFLNPSGPWSCLKHEAENLGMIKINKYDVYYNFIFPNFHYLDSNAQLDHLIFIRTEIYPECKHALKISDSSSNKAKNFVTALKSLQCIPDLTGTLHTIGSFYDHNEKIFLIFHNESCFLPNKFRNSKWRSFFQYFGLNTVPTYEEFVSYCKSLPNLGSISAITAGSELLLNVLFDVSDASAKKYKHIYLPKCLQEVSQIPIAIVEKLPDLDCIKEQKMGELKILSVTLTKLYGSSILTNAKLVWTILPLIKLPHIGGLVSNNLYERLKCLGIVQSPCVEDVISNLRNLSSSTFANYDRFEKYSMTTNSSLLPSIVVTMMKYLQEKLQQDNEFENICNQLKPQLSILNFLPVKLPIQNTEAYALVKPIQVLCIEPSEVTPYYPFLHPLIDEANSVIKLLAKIGVTRSFHLSHVQFVLQSIKDLCQDNAVVFNNKHTVLRATRELIRLLKQLKNNNDAINYLKPLYLLSQENILTECSKLIVHDIPHDFPPPVGYAYLNLFKDAEQSIKELPRLLPKELGLKRLQSITTYELIDSKPAKEIYSNVSIIKEILHSAEFIKAIEIYSSCCNQGVIPPCVTDILTDFQSKLTVQVLIDVQAKPMINVDDNVFPIDDIKEYSFFWQKFDQKWVLSLKNTQDRYRPSVFTKFANQLCSNLELKSTKCFEFAVNDEIPALTEFVYHILQCKSVSKIAEIIKEHLPGMHNIEPSSFGDQDPVLGDSVPEQFHYMLDQSMFNFFYPEEWVGYEDEHGKIVCAQILCEMICDNNNPAGNKYQQMMEKRYIISLGLSETNIEVGALQLYKFIQNKALKDEKRPGISEVDVDDAPGTSESEYTKQFKYIKMDSEKRRAKKKVTDKKTIREAVKAAWALPEEQRRKAIKRLFLQHHPDKNPDNPNATADFQFLQQEVERLENGISEDEADGKGRAFSHYSHSSDSKWHSWFNQWNHTASSHNFFRSKYSRTSAGNKMPGAWNIPQPQPDLTESERWIGQAKYDYSALCVLKDASRTNNEVSAATCFMCHEVAEKSLKAGLFAKCGMGEVSLKNHDLILPANALIQLGCPIDKRDAEFLEQFYLDTRFPNCYPPPVIPGEKFSSDMANQGFDAATRIYEAIKQLIH